MQADVDSLKFAVRGLSLIDLPRRHMYIDSIHRMILRLQTSQLGPIGRDVLASDRVLGAVSSQYEFLIPFFTNVHSDIREMAQRLGVLYSVVDDLDPDLASLNRSLINVTDTLSSGVWQLESTDQCLNIADMNQTVLILASDIQSLRLAHRSMNETLWSSLGTLMIDAATLGNTTSSLEDSFNLALNVTPGSIACLAALEELEFNVTKLRSSLDTLNTTMTIEITRVERLLSEVYNDPPKSKSSEFPTGYDATTGRGAWVNSSLPTSPEWTTRSELTTSRTTDSNTTTWAIIGDLKDNFQNLLARSDEEMAGLNETLVDYKASVEADSDRVEQGMSEINSTIADITDDVGRNNHSTGILVDDLLQRLADLERRLAKLG